MRPWAALVLILSACGRIGFGTGDDTALQATISVAPGLTLADLDARLAFATLDPTQLYAVPAAGGTPALPTEASFALPDASGELVLSLTAHDAHGNTVSGSATVAITAGETGTVAIVLGGDRAATCFDGVTDGDETDLDCGGSCASCAAGGTCGSAGDCGTSSCVANHCEPASGPPSWLPVADMPVGRIGLAAVTAADQQIYIYGGADNDGDPGIAEVDVYDVVNGTWGAAPPILTPRLRIAGASDATGTVYAMGGAGPSAVVESYTPGMAQWATQPSLPVGLQSIGAVADRSGTVFAIGGTDGANNYPYNDALAGSGWAMRAPLPTARGNIGAALGADGKLYAVGGHAPEVSTIVELYDPATDAWQTGTSMTHARSDLAAVSAPDGRVYAMGGFDGVNSGVAFVEAYRAGATSWVDAAPMAFARDACAAAIGPDGRIYVFGGRTDAVGAGSLPTAEGYGPQLMIGATSVAAGGTFSATGRNFAPSSNVRIYLDAVPLAVAPADASGDLAPIVVRVPATFVSGVHALRAIDDRSLYPVGTGQPFTIP